MTDFYQMNEAQQSAAMMELARAALPQWGLQGSKLQLIKYRENAVFRVDAPTGARYALRIHRHGYHSDAELRSEVQWIQALSQAGIQVPTVVPSLSGDLLVRMQAGAVPEERQIDLFEWLEGEPLGSSEQGITDRDSVAANYRTLGALAARVHNQASGWREPEGFTRHAWDLEGLVGENPFWGRFWELEALTAEQRQLLIKARDVVFQDLSDYGNKPENRNRYSMIHADFVSDNLMVDSGDVRLIDFDDAGYGWHLFELATALYFELGEPHYEDAYTALIEGYRSERGLPDEQVAQLPLFMLARSFTYLGWVRTRQEAPAARELTPMLIEGACTLAASYPGVQ